MENLFNVNQVAFILKVHPLTIRRYIREGKLIALKAGGNVRIAESQLQALTKTFSPKPQSIKQLRNKHLPTKLFTTDDPFLRLEGRGSGLVYEG
jgi:excisionase family DNA binding protein